MVEPNYGHPSRSRDFGSGVPQEVAFVLAPYYDSYNSMKFLSLPPSFINFLKKNLRTFSPPQNLALCEFARYWNPRFSAAPLCHWFHFCLCFTSLCTPSGPPLEAPSVVAPYYVSYKPKSLFLSPIFFPTLKIIIVSTHIPLSGTHKINQIKHMYVQMCI